MLYRRAEENWHYSLLLFIVSVFFSNNSKNGNKIETIVSQ